MSDAPQLLVEWPSPWREFLSAVGPALRPSPPRLGQETRAGLFPGRGMAVALVLEAAALASAIARPVELEQPVESQLTQPTHDVIYFSADELPRTEDLAGATAGTSGASGGASIHHPSQTIKVARGERLRDRVSDAPKLNLPIADSQLSDLLAYKVVPGPAPAEALRLERKTSFTTMAVVAPSPELGQLELRPHAANPAKPKVAPPPVTLPREQPRLHGALADPIVVPPPVSAPAQATNRPAQLTLPMASVVAPPPEVNGIAQLRRESSDFAPRVVPPPSQLDAVRNNARPSLVSGRSVAPPPAEIRTTPRAVSGLGNSRVAAPLVDLRQAPLERRVAASGGAVVLHPAEDPKSDVATTAPAPAAGPGGLSSAGLVVSSKPGDKSAVPPTPERGSLAISKSGSAATGSGGSGGGRGFGVGKGSGSSATGSKAGTVASGEGAGATLSARNTGTPYPGPDGAGDRTHGPAFVPGVSVSGGNNVITLPSFGPPPPATQRAGAPQAAANAVTVIASPRAGGALSLYGALRGDRVYTIYLNTQLGMAVMQFADPASAEHAYGMELAAPRAVRVDLPSELSQGEHSQLLVRCQIDQNGEVRNARVLRAGNSALAEKVLTGLRSWKFTPAFRGDHAVAVDAILGFGVGTN